MKWINEKKKTKKKKSKQGKKDGLFGMVGEVRDRSVSDYCFVFEAVFRCLLSCMIKVDVIDY
ncbi:hypothetical protein QJS04_geneDACA016041 [Acorus gramineus]|uniref:Uncharacterized protein n=1 Tax=Acorus gramineus TaxID=55184 RepID=A0AAV9BJF9_ACOGR|nr:hypothetical protein QJS04_geneDACA016041 [Acorus gramineus]